MLAMTYHIPNFEHEDQIALSALSQLLSSGKSSILQKVLVDEKRLANSVYAYNMELKDPEFLCLWLLQMKMLML